MYIVGTTWIQPQYKTGVRSLTRAWKVYDAIYFADVFLANDDSRGKVDIGLCCFSGVHGVVNNCFCSSQFEASPNLVAYIVVFYSRIYTLIKNKPPGEGDLEQF